MSKPTLKNTVLRFFKKNDLRDTQTVDKLLVSSFLQANGLKLKNNKLILDYTISKKDKHNFDILTKLNELIASEHKVFVLEDLISIFESVISPLDKIVTGAVYTPKSIREFIITNTFKTTIIKIQSAKVADIACGCGSFLLDAAKAIRKKSKKTYSNIYKDNIFGLDIQEYSIQRTKILLSLLALIDGEDVIKFQFNLFQGDALNFKWIDVIDQFTGFDIIIGNPPYVCSKNIPEITKQYLFDWDVCKTGRPDLYIPFFQIGIENLCKKGVLGYITMNTFFKSVNGRALREYFQTNKFKFQIIDFGSQQVFNSKSTYTCICLIGNFSSPYLEYTMNDPNALNEIGQFSQLRYDDFDYKVGWNLQDTEVIRKIENIGRPFGELYNTKTGIATLKNDVYIFTPVKESKEFYYFENGRTFEIEKGICLDIINSNKLTQVDDISLVLEKIIFPYYFNGGHAKLYTERELKNRFPKAYKYLKSQKDFLATRDRGLGDYENWFAYGRNQSLEKMKNKLLFPHIASRTPNFVKSTDENLLFYNGLAVLAENEIELLFLQKLLGSDLFWYYINRTSKPYGSGYFSLSRNYIKSFGIAPFTENEKISLINETDPKKWNKLINEAYGVLFPAL
ncbi:class I SAM-dependent DNA methyltransferase [Chitinophaga sp. Ak27]|uniref:HsdM family class I SAM-dependent methyltransferase n=1 Tax=Chitinophaga sp. Ak27 TaxID=2726116 RepID=UPI00145F4E41|nr:N-6 DNA methylase [Chitinophaga sp. Ak27]NLU96287.1 SAM-dependent DNA methyltransferase [Chitinophaga sp. Ak27]